MKVNKTLNLILFLVLGLVLTYSACDRPKFVSPDDVQNTLNGGPGDLGNGGDEGNDGNGGESCKDPDTPTDLPEDLPPEIPEDEVKLCPPHISRPGHRHCVAVCHKPRGNIDNTHTIFIGVSAVLAHLAHDDHVGSCDKECGEVDAQGKIFHCKN